MDRAEYEKVTGDTDRDIAPTASSAVYPASWQREDAYDPNDTMMKLKGKEYLNAHSRLQWFIRDQRHLIMRGLARTSYIVQTTEVHLDLEAGFAEFKTTVRDVLGNECTMYGSETAKDFDDYIEKAGTKSMSRALAGLGYSTEGAQDFAEGEGNLADAPRAPRGQQHNSQQRSQAYAQQRTTTSAQNTGAAHVTSQAHATAQPQTTPPVRAAVHADALRRANQQEQADLYATLKEYFSGKPTVENFLEGALAPRSRHIDASLLPTGKTDLSVGEIAAILKLLDNYPKLEKAGQSAQAGQAQEVQA